MLSQEFMISILIIVVSVIILLTLLSVLIYFIILYKRGNNNSRSSFTVVSPPLNTITIHPTSNNNNFSNALLYNVYGGQYKSSEYENYMKTTTAANGATAIGTRVPERLEIYVIRKDSDGLGNELEENLAKLLQTRIIVGHPPPQMPLPPPLHLTAEKRSLILYVVAEESYHCNNDEEAGYFYCAETDECTLLQIGATFNNHLLGYLVVSSNRSQSIMVSQMYPDSACEDSAVRLGNVPPLVSNLKITLNKDNHINMSDPYVSKTIDRLKLLIQKRQSA